LRTTQTVTFYEFGTMVDAHIWIAPRAGKVVSIKEIHSVVGGAACAVRPRKITDTSAPGAVASATVKEITQQLSIARQRSIRRRPEHLSATASDYTFAAGDKISLDVSGTHDELSWSCGYGMAGTMKRLLTFLLLSSAAFAQGGALSRYSPEVQFRQRRRRSLNLCRHRSLDRAHLRHR
jgi:hypothetical protein